MSYITLVYKKLSRPFDKASAPYYLLIIASSDDSKSCTIPLV